MKKQDNVMKVRLTLLDEVLGSQPSSPDIHEDYIASKAPTDGLTAEEVDNIKAQNAEDKVTVFYKQADETPAMYDYQLKGLFKDSCKMLAKAGKAGYPGGKACAALKAYKQAIDGLLFVEPRELPFDLHGMKMDFCVRPLRASTPMGERVSIAKSETVPAGSTIEFDIRLLDPKLEDMVRECLDYGKLRGLGQWRNSGKCAVRCSRRPAVTVFVEAALPAEYVAEKITKSPDKTAIKAAIKAGIEVPGAALVDSLSVSVK